MLQKKKNENNLLNNELYSGVKNAIKFEINYCMRMCAMLFVNKQ